MSGKSTDDGKLKGEDQGQGQDEDSADRAEAFIADGYEQYADEKTGDHGDGARRFKNRSVVSDVEDGDGNLTDAHPEQSADGGTDPTDPEKFFKIHF